MSDERASGFLSVAQAASALDISLARVRQLIAKGDLPSVTVGRHVLVDVQGVRARSENPPLVGRPLSGRLTWATLRALSDPQALGDFKDRQLRHRVRMTLAQHRGAEEWTRLFGRRATPKRFWAHPATVRDLLKDPSVSPGRARAAALAGLDISVGDDAVLYVATTSLARLTANFALVPDVAGQILLQVYDSGARPFAPDPGKPVPLAAAVFDLADSSDARMRAAAKKWLRRHLPPTPT